ncbi:hypothetical protein FisN_7Lh035 [Fistulifera solaris]|uniref:Uncharacterized protein n=1 Tax=Fistulifera solaris TaxID=1519565 RepID=A0A1Z5JCG1_FISSO|nr:hypothetical protein FisN_7Lh035 [Fistulifera solaris]|eukprot:GAX11669.1 hypothetical protein FisN_7Lh035 [Fistulifera solaris]
MAAIPVDDSHNNNNEEKETYTEDTTQSTTEAQESYIQDNFLDVVEAQHVKQNVQQDVQLTETEEILIEIANIEVEIPATEEAPYSETDEGKAPQFETDEGKAPQFETDEGKAPQLETDEGEAPQLETDEGEAPQATDDDKEEVPQSENDNSRPDNDNITRQSSMDYIREYFPECISETGMIDLKASGSYQPVLPGTQPRYDHFSCYLMKARYNCAHPPDYDKPEASDYELVLYLGYENNTKPCRLRSVSDALGGPVGLAQRPSPTSDTVPNSPIRITFHGSSYVRQMWEAMTCGFRDDITQLLAKQPGPDVSLPAMERRNHSLIGFSEIGKPIRSTEWIQKGRCHGVYKNELAEYYRAGVLQVPGDTIDGCNDSIAMVRFQQLVEVYYVFRPNDFSANAFNRIYSDFFQLTDNAGNDVSSISQKVTLNALVWNMGLEKPENILPNGVQAKQEIGVDPWLQILMALQRRDIGVYFGADNPWITKPPDGHPCMPGIPDDEVNLVLYSLYTGYTII